MSGTRAAPPAFNWLGLAVALMAALSLVGGLVWLVNKRVNAPLEILSFSEVPAWTNAKTLTIEGKANKLVTITVESDSSSSADDGSFRRIIKLDKEIVDFEFSIKDGFGGSEVRRFSVRVDQSNPEISIDNTNGGTELVIAESGVVAGQIKDNNSLASATLDGQPLALSESGRFEFVHRGEATKTYNFKARDLAGNVASFPLTVLVRPPLIFESLELPKSWTAARKVTIRGQLNRPRPALAPQ
jgi:hypothetical protein